MSPVKRDQQDILRELDDQLYFLHTSCVAFDNGIEIEAKRIAATLRVLLHDTAASKSLLGQIERKNEFLDTSFCMPKRIVRVGEEGAKSDERRLFFLSINRGYAPLFFQGPDPSRKLDFIDWWNGEVFRDVVPNTHTRKSIVLGIANQDGGAHVDPFLKKSYFELTRELRHGNLIRKLGPDSTQKWEPIKSPHLVIARQVAHEVLATLLPLYNYTAIEKYPGLIIGGMQLTYKPLDQS